MKKLLVVLLALTFVVAMATAAFAVTTSSVDGKVEWTLTNTAQMGGSVDGKIVFDLGKDFGEGYSAGLTIKLDPNGDTGATPPVPEFEEAIYTDGWIKMVKDFGTFTFQTSGLGGNAANELGGKYDMASAAGVKFESSSLVEGLALTVVLNDTFKTDPVDATRDGYYYNYLLKGVYTADALTIGAGYQAHTVPAGVTDSTQNDAMAVWASYKISDAMSAGLEYASRPNVTANGTNAIKAKFGYSADPLTVNAMYISKAAGWVSEDADAWDLFKTFMNDGVVGGFLGVDATYKIGDALSVYGKVQDIMEDTRTVGNMLIQAGAKYAFTDAISVDGNYTTVNTTNPNSKIVVTLTDTLVAGLVASLEVKSETLGLAPAVNSYTAKLTATL